MTAPFGIALGSTPNPSKAIYKVVFTSIPRHHPKFPLVTGRWTPETGLYEIVAESYTYEGGAYGVGIRSEFEKIKNQISEIYGDYSNGETCDLLHQYELLSINVGTCCLPECIISICWSRECGSNLPDDLDHITLSIQAISELEARIALVYAAVRQQGLTLRDVL